eukprot:scaffold70749_cov62-Phaeocystis_antarctica.AAC.4
MIQALITIPPVVKSIAGEPSGHLAPGRHSLAWSLPVRQKWPAGQMMDSAGEGQYWPARYKEHLGIVCTFTDGWWQGAWVRGGGQGACRA